MEGGSKKWIKMDKEAEAVRKLANELWYVGYQAKYFGSGKKWEELSPETQAAWEAVAAYVLKTRCGSGYRQW